MKKKVKLCPLLCDREDNTVKSFGE